MAKGDHIAIIGNTLADRMQHFGHLEALVQSRFPGQELVFRNLGFSGDELTLRLRSAGFGSPDDHLTAVEADVVLAFFGYNESFAGAEGLDKFKHDLADFIKHTLGQKYNGEDAPRLVLLSPIAHEDLARPQPAGRQRPTTSGSSSTRRPWRDVAAAHEVPFVDLFAPSQPLYERSEPAAHDQRHPPERDAATGKWRKRSTPRCSAIAAGCPTTWPLSKSCGRPCSTRTSCGSNKYRTTDGYSIFGGRADLKFVNDQTNREVTQRELEILDVHDGQSRRAHLGRGPRQRSESRRLATRRRLSQ